ncbi:MAG: cytochrome c maturation protein CcmE [Myxococcales bacterium]|nr:cytochrome c maturation protein CcmE [Myxococcales bacterium]
MTDAMRNRLFGVAAVLVAAGALAWIAMSDLGDNLVYYWSPTELMTAENAQDATVRLGGMVVPGTMKHDTDKAHLAFDVTDGTTTVSVFSEGNPPQMFREGIGVVVEGQLAGDGVFKSDKVMVKHSNEYEAPDGTIDMKKMQETLADGEARR